MEREGRYFPASPLLLQAGLERRWGGEARSRDKLAPCPSRLLPRDCNPKVGSFKLGSERGGIFAKLGVGRRLFPPSRVHSRRVCPPGKTGWGPQSLPGQTETSQLQRGLSQEGLLCCWGVGNLLLLNLPPQLLKHFLHMLKSTSESRMFGVYPERCHLPLLLTGAHRQARDDSFSGPQFPQLGSTKGWPRRLWGFWPQPYLLLPGAQSRLCECEFWRPGKGGGA